MQLQDLTPPAPSLKSRILVVEDHPLFRERLASLITGEPDLQLCGEAESVEQALEIARNAAPDLVMLDISLPGASGMAFLKAFQELDSKIPVLVLSMHDEKLYGERVYRAGAKGYMTKHRAASDVLSAIRRILAGEVYFSDQLLAIVRSGKSAQRDSEKPNVGRLTDREMEVLRLIAKGLTTRAIADELSLGVASIDTYRARIKEKMHLSNGNELQLFAMRCFVSE